LKAGKLPVRSGSSILRSLPRSAPKGMTDEDNLELWSFIRRASFPEKIGDLIR
jgi:hypothetical protein